MNLCLYKIELYYGTGGILVDDNCIVYDAKRQLRWMKGETIQRIIKYVYEKGGTISLTAKFRR